MWAKDILSNIIILRHGLKATTLLSRISRFEVLARIVDYNASKAQKENSVEYKLHLPGSEYN